jgi:hypothetical protein
VREAVARLWRARALAGAGRDQDAVAEAEHALAVVDTGSDLAVESEARELLDQLRN